MLSIYTNPICPHCISLKNWLDENNISFQEFDVTKDLQARKRYLDMTPSLAVPVWEIVNHDNRKIGVGFQKKAIQSSLSSKSSKPNSLRQSM